MNNRYESPLNTRYASKEMQEIFSADNKFRTWRRLWIALAEAEKDLGLPITDEQIAELKSNWDKINYDDAKNFEKKLRHDVMAHVHAYAKQCPSAGGIIHLGATSCYVGDNTDLIVMREALRLIKSKLLALMSKVSEFSMKYRSLPCLGYTHFQPAQPVSVGKRASLWLQDLESDYHDLEYVMSGLRLLGSKGTTGTQASFLDLFEGDHSKCEALDERIAASFEFPGTYPVSGQTYSRKVDSRVICLLAGIAQSAHKFSNDLRLLQHMKEIEEPFEKDQIGSSAMAYKRNPMRSERMAALSRYLIALSFNPMQTAAEQWLERTLDDSANRRMSIAESFLCCDAILEIYLNISSGLVVYPMSIKKNLMRELPFMATENILMEAVKKGGDRQKLHEKIRRYSVEVGKNVKEKGLPNNMLELLASDPEFSLSSSELNSLLEPSLYIGRSAEQVENYIEKHIKPILEKEASDIYSKDTELEI